MSYDRREFLKTLTLGGIALFTADWFAAVQAREPAKTAFRLPAHAKDLIPGNHDVINAVWNDGTGYILYLNGTPYGEPPKISLREKLIEEGEGSVCETIDECRKYVDMMLSEEQGESPEEQATEEPEDYGEMWKEEAKARQPQPGLMA
jgi:hypothetical protein